MWSFFAKRKRKQRRPRYVKPELTVKQILAWADAHCRATGQWPTRESGQVTRAAEDWRNVDQALRKGLRGLMGGSSLARLLAEHRGVRNRKALPPLTEDLILAWADADFARHGHWPHAMSGSIPEAPSENWLSVVNALRLGLRSLPGGSSLARLLVERRGASDYYHQTPLSVPRILAWADRHHARTGEWPAVGDGPVVDAPTETWKGLDGALRRGVRTLPGGTSLAKLLAAERGARNQAALPRLTQLQILGWVDAHLARTGTWPTEYSGAIPEASGETWAAVNWALTHGKRGLRGGLTLAQLLAQHRGKRLQRGRPPLTLRNILAWCDAHHARTGRWPHAGDGPIPEASGETWGAVESALRAGRRGLSGGSSLARLLARQRGVRNQAALPPLATDRILGWADLHRARTGRWPTSEAGPVQDVPGHTWRHVDVALRHGLRGLPGGSSLAQLLAEQRGVRNTKALPALTLAQVRKWCAAHRRRTGRWPRKADGEIAGAAGETWSGVDTALHRGTRGLPGGSSLFRLGQ